MRFVKSYQVHSKSEGAIGVDRVVTLKKHKPYNTSDWSVLTHQLQSEIDFTSITKHSKFEEIRIANDITNTTIHLKG